MMPKLAVLTILAVIVVSAIPVAATTDVISSSWRDSGYDLAAGYRYTITLQSGCVWTGACAEAGFDATVVKAELSGSHLKVWANGDLILDEDIGEESATITITVECDGSGSIELSGYGNLGGFSIDHSYRIMVYRETESVWPQTVTSQVTISRQAMNCQVTNPSLTPHQEDIIHQIEVNPLFASITAALGSAAGIAVVIIILVLGLLLIAWILGKAGGAKKIIKKAL